MLWSWMQRARRWQWRWLGVALHRKAAVSQRARLRLEPLEDRLVPNAYLWTGANVQVGSDAWSVLNNWLDTTVPNKPVVPLTPPGFFDDVTFNPGVANGGNTTSLVDTATTIHSLNIAAGYTSEIFLRGSLNVGTIVMVTILGIPVPSPVQSRMAGGTITHGAAGAGALNIAFGSFDWSGGSITNGALAIGGLATLNLSGTVTLDNSTLLNFGSTLLNAGAAVNAQNGAGIGNLPNASLTFQGGNINNPVGAATLTNAGNMTVNGNNTVQPGFSNVGSLTISGSATLTLNKGTAEQDQAPALIPAPTTSIAAGTLVVTDANGYQVKAGTLNGSSTGATVSGNLNNSGGTVVPGGTGGTTGVLTVTGNYTQGAGGTFNPSVNFINTTNSSMTVQGTATLAGTLSTTFVGPTQRPSKWPIIKYGAIAGDFAKPFQTNGPMYEHLVPDQNMTYYIQIPAPKGMGININPTEGAAFSGPVANFTDGSDSGSSGGAYTAEISWGDGSVSQASTADGSIAPDGSGGWNVKGIHTYSDEGSDTITVAISAPGDPTTLATTTSKATVTDAALTASGVGGTVMAGVPFERVMATFTDANPDATPADFRNTSIFWGDGSSSPGVVTQVSTNLWQVSGVHTYSQPGTYPGSVTISDDGGQSALAGFGMTVSPAPLGLSLPNLSAPSLPAATVSAVVVSPQPLSLADAGAMLAAATAPTPSLPAPGSPALPAASATPPAATASAPAPLPTLSDDALSALSSLSATPTSSGPSAADPLADPLTSALAAADLYFGSV